MNEFGDIIGNEQVIKTLKSSVLRDTVSHAYIFEGPEGSGKRLLANSFTKFLFCATKNTGCRCHSCIQFDSGNHSDLFYIRRGGEKSLGVELMRESVVDELSKKPFEYQKKVFIIEDAHTLTDQAQNALLRSIEEPPEYAVIILLANGLSFLPTVLSRCFIYKMRTFSADFILEHLKSRGLAEPQSVIASEFSPSIGGALALYENEDFFEMRRNVNDSLAILSAEGLAEFYSRARGLEEYKPQAEQFCRLILMWLRDVLAYKATGDFSLVCQKDYGTDIKAAARKFSFKSLYKKIDGVMAFTENLAANAGFPAALDALAIRLSK